MYFNNNNKNRNRKYYSSLCLSLQSEIAELKKVNKILRDDVDAKEAALAKHKSRDLSHLSVDCDTSFVPSRPVLQALNGLDSRASQSVTCPASSSSSQLHHSFTAPSLSSAISASSITSSITTNISSSHPPPVSFAPKHDVVPLKSALKHSALGDHPAAPASKSVRLDPTSLREKEASTAAEPECNQS